jgi:hypothetical protein
VQLTCWWVGADKLTAQRGAERGCGGSGQTWHCCPPSSLPFTPASKFPCCNVTYKPTSGSLL